MSSSEMSRALAAAAAAGGGGGGAAAAGGLSWMKKGSTQVFSQPTAEDATSL